MVTAILIAVPCLARPSLGSLGCSMEAMMNNDQIADYVTRTMKMLYDFHSSDGNVVQIAGERLRGILHLAMHRAVNGNIGGSIDPSHQEATPQLTLTAVVKPQTQKENAHGKQ